ncbi:MULTISPECIES: hypothetical protein [Stenotrophomonas]|jgi:hypothetical protein|uniref:Uncharacterized protein n=1 Tax=Stenotrophomonas maltophilia TaxID=40324 RepID=A0AAD0BUP4_STEMA|nr:MULTISPECIES: hypothetical protein [Stenotrophomonas]HCT28677.1 hypothetical protein [Stenotrophomonas sp.]AUI05852.1 hypothetical protein SmaCSM2_01130 [Stenotrophomonas maltophilia]EKU9974261.1 hypothetical protein [Stenotrophomonas maltophilia]MBA2129484.1 hypothetical protein [Stenotrophomonas maltophilia]MBH1682261.1 hypothetical protein [Stenotrophomonas maltophilia]
MKPMMLVVLLSAFSLPLSMPAVAGDDVASVTGAENVSLMHAPVNSRGRLDLHMIELSPESPLMLLSPLARKQFVDSLVFGDRGLASFSYEPIVSELSAGEAYRLLSLFGAQRAIVHIPGLRQESEADHVVVQSANPNPVFEDYPGYACSGRATCSTSMSSICMSSC